MGRSQERQARQELLGLCAGLNEGTKQVRLKSNHAGIVAIFENIPKYRKVTLRMFDAAWSRRRNRRFRTNQENLHLRRSVSNKDTRQVVSWREYQDAVEIEWQILKAEKWAERMKGLDRAPMSELWEGIRYMFPFK